MKNGTASAKENSAAALGNLAHNNTDNQVTMVKAGAILPLAKLAKNGIEIAVEKANDLLNILCRRTRGSLFSSAQHSV